MEQPMIKKVVITFGLILYLHPYFMSFCFLVSSPQIIRIFSIDYVSASYIFWDIVQ